ncbi:hypothetical protein PAXRUDRAFT_181107, partial [Paxillus rubicundulus Ve08.2h10]
DPHERNGVAIAWSLDPHNSLGGTQVALIEKVMTEKNDQLLTSESFSKGVMWTNMKERGGFTKNWIYGHVSKEPTISLISGFWPLPLADQGEYLRCLWTLDWKSQMTALIAELILKAFDPAIAVMYNLLDSQGNTTQTWGIRLSKCTQWSPWMEQETSKVQIGITPITVKKLILCPICLGIPLAKAEHTPDHCGRLKILNQKRTKDNLQEVKITPQGVAWVNAPPELDVQTTLHSLLLENKLLKQGVSNLEEKVETLTTKLEEVTKALAQKADQHSSQPKKPQKEQEKHEGSGHKGTRGRGNGRSGRRGGAPVA